MRDIGVRIQRYRLSRYAPPDDRSRRRLRWIWLVGAVWLVWVGFVSDHNAYRIWKLSQEERVNRQEIARLARESDRLEREASDPRLRRKAAEAYLRERAGMARPDEIVYQRR
jgi:cell division protein FtsB